MVISGFVGWGRGRGAGELQRWGGGCGKGGTGKGRGDVCVVVMGSGGGDVAVGETAEEPSHRRELYYERCGCCLQELNGHKHDQFLRRCVSAPPPVPPHSTVRL